jgi:L-fucose/D-arabinose isomerase
LGDDGLISVAILSFSDGRKRVHDGLAPYILEQELRIRQALEGTGEVRVTVADEIIWQPELAREQAKKIAGLFPDAVILNVPVFAFPNLAVIAASLQSAPCLAISPVNGKMPGLGGLQAAVNAIRQVGMSCEKIWGNVETDPVMKKLMTFLRAAHAVTSLRGQVYGLIGGRSIGMVSGAASPDAWMRVFGVDVDHIDQLEIIRRAGIIEESKVDRALEWLAAVTGSIRYDQGKLTTDSLRMQIKCYIATKDLIAERKLDFIGVKCHYDLSEYYVTQCLAAALCNDPYDWDGPKEPVVYSCEADSDGALTMQVMKLVSGLPALFFDFRHYDAKEGVFVFCNCGAMATWYAQRSEDPAMNLKSVNLCPIIPKYGGSGCHVQYIAKEGEMTLGRLSRVGESYKMTLFRGRFRAFPEEKLAETCPVWPHGFVAVDADPENLIERYESNHVHGVYGDHIDELVKFCELKKIQCEVIR